MKANLPHILVVDDDKRLRELISKYLRDHDMVVVSTESAELARANLKEMIFDLIILDVMMPHETGHDFLKKLRKDNTTLPVLMLTALGDSPDRIKGLELGADDYMAKPFEPKELLLRIESILRRSKVESDVVKFGDYEFNMTAMSVKKAGKPLHLTESDISILKAIAEKKGEAITREELSETIGDINERAVDVQVMRLRKKVEDDPKRPVYIQTVRGKGYKLNVS